MKKKNVILIISFLIFIFFMMVIIYYKFIVNCSKNPSKYTQEKYTYHISSKYQEFLKNSEIYTSIPGLKEHIIPQALTYSPKYNKFIIVGYHSGKAASVLFFIDCEAKKLEKSILLKYNDNTLFNTHIGGLTTNDETVWLSDNYHLYTISLESLIEAADMSFLNVSEPISILTKGDYITYHDNKLYVGEYDYKIKYKTKKEHYFKTPNGTENKSLIAIFDITKENINFLEPVSLVSVPDRVQGLAFDDDFNLILSRSFWSFQSSQISTYKNPFDLEAQTLKINDKKYPIWYLDNSNLISDIKIPPMSEGIVYLNNELYIIFESASSYYKMYTHDKIADVIKLKKW